MLSEMKSLILRLSPESSLEEFSLGDQSGGSAHGLWFDPGGEYPSLEIVGGDGDSYSVTVDAVESFDFDSGEAVKRLIVGLVAFGARTYHRGRKGLLVVGKFDAESEREGFDKLVGFSLDRVWPASGGVGNVLTSGGTETFWLGYYHDKAYLRRVSR